MAINGLNGTNGTNQPDKKDKNSVKLDTNKYDTIWSEWNSLCNSQKVIDDNGDTNKDGFIDNTDYDFWKDLQGRFKNLQNVLKNHLFDENNNKINNGTPKQQVRWRRYFDFYDGSQRRANYLSDLCNAYDNNKYTEDDKKIIDEYNDAANKIEEQFNNNLSDENKVLDASEWNNLKSEIAGKLEELNTAKDNANEAVKKEINLITEKYNKLLKNIDERLSMIAIDSSDEPEIYDSDTQIEDNAYRYVRKYTKNINFDKVITLLDEITSAPASEQKSKFDAAKPALEKFSDEINNSVSELRNFLQSNSTIQPKEEKIIQAAISELVSSIQQINTIKNLYTTPEESLMEEDKKTIENCVSINENALSPYKSAQHIFNNRCKEWFGNKLPSTYEEIKNIPNSDKNKAIVGINKFLSIYRAQVENKYGLDEKDYIIHPMQAKYLESVVRLLEQAKIEDSQASIADIDRIKEESEKRRMEAYEEGALAAANLGMALRKEQAGLIFTDN